MSTPTLNQPSSPTASGRSSGVTARQQRDRPPPRARPPSTSRSAPMRPGTPERAELKARLDVDGRASASRFPSSSAASASTPATSTQSVMPHDHGHVLADYHQADARARAAGHRRRHRGAARVGELALGRSRRRVPQGRRAPRRRPGAARSTPRRCSASRRPCHQSEIDAACELIDFWRFNVQLTRRRSTTTSRSATAACGISSTTAPLEGFVYAVSPFNFTAIGGNLSGAPALMGNSVLWKPASSAMLSAWYVFRVLEEAGLPPGVINFVPGQRRRDLERRALAPRPRRRPLHRQHLGLQRHVEDDRREHVPLPLLPAHRRRNRRQGLHRRPPVGGSGGGGGGDRARRLRVPGPEVLGREPRLRPAVAVARGARPHASRSSSSIKMGDVRDFRNFMGAVIDKKRVRRRSASTSTKRKKSATIVAGGKVDGSTRLLHLADPGRDERPGLQAALRGDLRPGRHRPRLPGRHSTARRCRLVDRTSPYALTGAVFARERTARREALHARCATPPATSTSTTSPPAPSSASSRSAARARRAPTTRPARSSTCCAGPACARSRRRSCRRPTTAIRSWPRNRRILTYQSLRRSCAAGLLRVVATF